MLTVATKSSRAVGGGGKASTEDPGRVLNQRLMVLSRLARGPNLRARGAYLGAEGGENRSSCECKPICEVSCG